MAGEGVYSVAWCGAVSVTALAEHGAEQICENNSIKKKKKNSKDFEVLQTNLISDLLCRAIDVSPTSRLFWRLPSSHTADADEWSQIFFERIQSVMFRATGTDRYFRNGIICSFFQLTDESNKKKIRVQFPAPFCKTGRVSTTVINS